MVIRGARCAFGPRSSRAVTIRIVGGRVTDILNDTSRWPRERGVSEEIDLSDYLVMPGLINAHDHLQFALYPKLADPPYQNYIDWGADIHNKFSEVISKQRTVPREVRLGWGGIRNLLGGATTVSHHDPLWPELQREGLPVRVLQRYGWGHSVALGGDLRAARSATPEGCPFIIHACEGVDVQSRDELHELERLGLLDDTAVIVHGLALDRAGIALMRKHRTSLIICPSSNSFLYGTLPDIGLLGTMDDVALGTDSPLTAEGDLLDEIRFAVGMCGISPDAAYRMVTEAPARILRLSDAHGEIQVPGVGDLIAVLDTGHDPAERLQELSINDVEFVAIGGRVQLASAAILERLPLSAKEGLEALWIDGTVRWLRAPVEDLLRRAEEVLGAGEARLGGRPLRLPSQSGV
jgi:cytosine/adenosine deaminase-related metal-dependent hydrolase